MLILSAPALSQGGQVAVTVNRTVKGQFVSVSQARQGETLVYRAVLKATGDASNVVIQLPLSQDFLYAGKLRLPPGAGAAFSADGQTFPASMTERNVRLIKITLPRVQRGSTTIISFNVQVL